MAKPKKATKAKGAGSPGNRTPWGLSLDKGSIYFHDGMKASLEALMEELRAGETYIRPSRDAIGRWLIAEGLKAIAGEKNLCGRFEDPLRPKNGEKPQATPKPGKKPTKKPENKRGAKAPQTPRIKTPEEKADLKKKQAAQRRAIAKRARGA